MSIILPQRGFIFWPVGTGDSTTVVLRDGVLAQIDLRHVGSAGDDGDPHAAIVDELVKLLPTPKGAAKPYLAAFGVTHLDKDHILGFRELLERVTIGDLWFTPRIFWELDEDPQAQLCDDAKAFVKEATRRMKLLKGPTKTSSGDRVRIIGSPDVLRAKKAFYKDIPDDAITVPGKTFTHIDGADESECFEAFVHAPFKDDNEGERNDTSFALQVKLIDGKSDARALLLGDLSYPVLTKIFDRSKADTLAFDVMGAPHHCSKSAMYWQGIGQSSATLHTDILDKIEKAARKGAHIIASSEPIPAADVKGANPPHRRAADRYRERVDAGHFLCTGETPSKESPEPIVFELDAKGVSRRDAGKKAASEPSKLSEAVRIARGAPAPAVAPVGFGRRT